MKIPIVSFAGWLLLLTVVFFYGYGIFEAINISWSKIPAEQPLIMPEFLTTTISSIQALLLTNLGILLGISVTNPNSAIARQLMLNNNISTNSKKTNPVTDPIELKDYIQLIALIIYLISLIACLITWAHNDFSSASIDVVSIISNSGNMFIGVVLAYLTAILNLK